MKLTCPVTVDVAEFAAAHGRPQDIGTVRIWRFRCGDSGDILHVSGRYSGARRAVVKIAREQGESRLVLQT